MKPMIKVVGAVALGAVLFKILLLPLLAGLFGLFGLVIKVALIVAVVWFVLQIFKGRRGSEPKTES